MKKDIDYDKLKTYIDFIGNGVIILKWGHPQFGFGEVTLDFDTFEVIHSERMSKEFCDEVIKKSVVKDYVNLLYKGEDNEKIHKQRRRYR